VNMLPMTPAASQTRIQNISLPMSPALMI
jgi:hypothetical protein